jgi:DNA-binding NarL/FixJ family response regulator
MRVFVVDSQPVFREGLKHIMSGSRDLTVVGEAATCRGLAQTLKDFELLILDGEMDSLTLLQSLDKARPKGRPPFTLVVAGKEKRQHAVQMLAAGADGYLNKSNSPEQMLTAIRKVSRGGKYVSPELAERLLFETDRSARPNRLSQREYQVLYMIASGLAVKEIAGKLSLSIKTVSTYRCRLLRKLNLNSNAELIRYALQEGVID